MRRVPLPDGHWLYVAVRGDGPPLLLVHGFSGARGAWPPEILSGLQQQCRVIAVDLLGHGDSDRCHDAKRFALEAQVDDLCRVLDARGVERAIWVGYSMGGRICLAAAVLRAPRVAGLVLEGASPGLRGAEQRRERRAADEALARELEEGGLEAFVERWMSLPLFASQRTLGPEILAAERRRRLTNDARSLAACLRGASPGAQPSFWDRLGQLRVRALLLAGEHDHKFRGIARSMAKTIPQAHARVIRGCGHAAHLERPNAWLSAVRRFVSGIESQGVPR